MTTPAYNLYTQVGTCPHHADQPLVLDRRHHLYYCATCRTRDLRITRWLALGFLAGLILLGYLAYWLEPITPTGAGR